MVLLVTGGAGFIGSNFILHVLKKHSSYTVVNLDKLTYAGNLENLKQLKSDSRHVFVEGDVCDGGLVRSLLADHKVDAIVNFAAESHVDRSIMGAAEFVRTNVVGTQILLDCAKEAGTKRFLQISTDEVYGSLGPQGAFTEHSPIHPNSPYAASKSSADLMVGAYGHTFGIPVLITRCSNNYGPYQFPEKLIPLMIVNALENRPLPVYGDGTNVRDWIHVSDHCEAVDRVLNDGRPGEVYNIGGGNEMPNIELVRLLLKLLEKPESLITFVKDRPGHDRRYAIDASKISAELKWHPAFTFEQGIKDTIQWYLDNRDWWERILSGEYKDYYRAMYGNR